MIEMQAGAMHGALPLFLKSPHHQIARSLCQGLGAGRMFADDDARPTAAVVSLARFGIAFAAGDEAHAVPLLACLRGWHSWYEVADPPAGWHPALAAWSFESHAVSRYGFACKASPFDLVRLRAMAVPPEGCAVGPYDRPLVSQALAETWSEDQTGAFLTADDFLRDGLGMALVRDGRLVAGCTSFCRHPDGYEAQVDTHPAMRGRGYATCVGAAFILEVLRRGQTPYWDAANRPSLRLAEKLGYVFTESYTAWILKTPEVSDHEIAEKVIGE